MPAEQEYMRLALNLAKKGYGRTSPNPMVGAVIVKSGRIIGRGWHHRAGEPHAEIEAIRDAQRRGHGLKGSTLYVTLEPCCTEGRTPACTGALISARIKRLVAGATDPNPQHCGKGFRLLARAGIEVRHGVLEAECEELNEAFNHWIVHRTPFVTVKAAMTLDGKIATANGESKWITGERARACAMRLREGSDAVLVGINTVLADDPSLTFRPAAGKAASPRQLRRIILDTWARTPSTAKAVTDRQVALTTIVVGESAPKARVAALRKKVRVLVAPMVTSPTLAHAGMETRKGVERRGSAPKLSRADSPALLDLPWLLNELGVENVTSLLVEGGGEINASFLLQALAHRIAFFYAPKVLGGHEALRAVGGEGARSLSEALNLSNLEWQKLGTDWLLTARVTKN